MSEDIEYRIEIVVERDGKEYHAYCPALKGLHASGISKEDAINNAAELARLYLISLIAHQEPIPVGTPVKELTTKESNICKKSGVDCVVRDFAIAPAR